MLLQTKLHPPTHTQFLVERHRLIRRLDQWQHSQIHLITAPAGYGKTTLLSHWVRNRFDLQSPTTLTADDSPQPRCLLAWLSLDLDDDHPIRFLRYLAAALHPAIPVTAAAVDALLSSTGAVDQALAALINTLAQPTAPPQKILCVLDNFHCLQSPAVHEVMQTLLDRGPQSVHWLIATRQTPPLRLIHHRLDGRLQEIKATELHFTAEESRIFFAGALNTHPLSEHDLAGLIARTAGWGAGMQLAVLALRQSWGQNITDLPPVQEALPLEQRYLEEYVVSELLGHASSPWRSFLLECSVLDEWSPDLCRAVTLQKESAVHLQTLAQMTSLLMAVSLPDQIYQCHAVLRQTLQSQLEFLYTPEQVATLHRRAAGEYAEQKQFDVALRHLKLANDPAAQIRLLEEQCLPALLRGKAQTVDHWLKHLETLSGTRSPRLALDAVWQCIINERPGYSERLATAMQTVAAALPPETTRHPWQQELLAQQASSSLLRGDLAGAQRQAEDAISLLDPTQSLALGACHLVLTNVGMMTGQIELLERSAEAAEAAFQRAECTVGIIAAQRTRAYSLFDSGAGMRAVQQYRRLIAFGRQIQADHLREFTPVYCSFGIGLYLLDQPDAAREQFALAAALGRALNDPFWVVLAELWIQVCTQIQAPHQPPPPPAPDLDGWERRYAEQAGSSRITLIEMLRARWYLLTNAPERAWEILAQSAFNPYDAPAPYHASTLIIYTQAYLVCGKSADQLAPAFERWTEFMNKQIHSVPLKLQFKLAATRLALAQGNHKRAVSNLNAVLEGVSSTGYLRIVLDELLWLAPLLPSCRAPLARQLQQTAAAQLHPQQAVLTEAEQRVLNGIGRNLTNRAIAAELYISPNTVNFHLKRIFAKLSVNSRKEAVAKAKASGLL
jgi:LuxR family maltose regulon positive regulatory protein